MTKKEEIFQEVLEERVNQDTEWGGPEHDDTHNMYDWFDFIGKQVFEGIKGIPRTALVKIAALAFAGIESIDRNELS